MKKQKSLVLNAILNALKALSTIIFPLITYPYITRILSVDNMGRIDFSLSVVNYFILLAAFGITSFAIRNGAQIRDDREKLNKFANQIFTINVITTLISSLLLLGLVFLPTKVADYRIMIMILGLTVVLSPLSVDWLYTIEEDFTYITLRSFFVQLMALVLMFCFVHNENDVYLYVLLRTLAASCGNLFNFFHSKKYIKLRPVKNTEWNVHKKSIGMFFVNSLALTIYLNSDTTLLGLMCNDRVVGLYGVATKVYTLIKQMFNAVVEAIIPRLAYLIKNDVDGFERLLRKVLSIAFMFMIPSSLGIVLLRKEIILIISGEEYIEASTTLAILAAAMFFAVIANILANGLLVCLGREKYVLRGTLISALANIALNFFFIPHFSENGAAITTVIAEMMVVIIAICYSKDYARRIIDVKAFFKYLLFGCIMFGAAYAIGYGIQSLNIALRVIIEILSSAAIYFALLAVSRDKLTFMILRAIKAKLTKVKAE